MTILLGTRARTVLTATLALVALALPAGTSAAGAATAATAASTSTTTSTTAAPRLIDYQTSKKFGKTVHFSSQVRRLHGAPADFKTFVGALAERLQAADDCDAAAIGVTVAKIRTDGFALGAVNDCGGYQALWARVDGTWQEIDGTQDSLECRTLAKYRVPSSIAGTSCYDYAENKARHYHQR